MNISRRSDSLFLRALDRFHLRRRFPDRPIESLKAGILKVGMVRDTKILEIKVTLPDPKTAQALALYLGEETVKLSRSVDEEGDQELTQAIEKQEADAQARLDQKRDRLDPHCSRNSPSTACSRKCKAAAN